MSPKNYINIKYIFFSLKDFNSSMQRLSYREILPCLFSTISEIRNQNNNPFYNNYLFSFMCLYI